MVFSRLNCKQFKYYERYQVETRYTDRVSEIEFVLIFVAMVNL